MTPEEIESAEFFVGMRGYERAEVRAFLEAVAAEHRALLERVGGPDPYPPLPTDPALDPVDQLGQHVAAIVRSARDSASALVEDAERAAAEIRTTAEQDAERSRRDADARRVEAERILQDARHGAARITEEAVARGQEQAEALVAEATRRHEEAVGARDEMIARLKDAVSGASMALLALQPDRDGAAVEADASST